jgi:hypothetical protein
MNCLEPDFHDRGKHIAKLTELESAGLLPVLPAHWQDWQKLYTLAKRVFPRDNYLQTELVSRTFLRCYKQRNSVCSAKRLIVTFWQLTRKLRRKDAHQNTQQIGLPEHATKPEPAEYAGDRQHIARRNADRLKHLFQ